MFKARNRDTAEWVARKNGLAFVGMSVFGGDWYAARTRDELARAGCAEIFEVKAEG